MADLNPRDRTLRVKIVYFGPALGGKTTNLQVLHRRATSTRRGDLLSVNSFQDRTILFDLLPLKAVGPRGFELRLQLLAVPGQSLYAATRRAALRGADGVVFVANSAADRWQENVRSMQEMNRYLLDQGIDPSVVPLVVQCNKRDLPEVARLEDMNALVNPRGEAAFPAVAVRAEGVIETFGAILERTLRHLSRQYRVLDIGAEPAIACWSQQALAGMFGLTAAAANSLERQAEPQFGMPAEFEMAAAPAPVPLPRTIRVSVPDSPRSGAEARLEKRSPEPTVEAYAQAGAELATLLAEAAAERDRACRRLAEIRRAAAIASEDGAGSAAAQARRALSCLAEAAEAAHATFVLWPELEGVPQAVALPPLPGDCLASRRHGVEYLRQAARASSAFLEEGGDDLELRALLGNADPPFAAVAVVPLRASGRLVGVALLYFVEGDALPGADTLKHLGVLGDIVAGSIPAPEAQWARPSGGELFVDAVA